MPVNPRELDLGVQLNQLEQALNDLKFEYEQYFMGMVRIEPAAQRKKVQRTLLSISSKPINNSGMRFRFQQLRARFNTYQTYWNRIMHQIETGRYVREEKRYQLKKKQQGQREGKAEKVSKRAGKDQDSDKAGKLYNEFIESRKRCGESTDNVSVERLSKFIKQQEGQLKAKYGERAIDFKVVVEGGRTKLRAILKK